MQIILYNRLPLPIAILMIVCSFCMTQAVALAEDKLPTIMEHWRAKLEQTRQRRHYNRKYSFHEGDHRIL